MLHRGALSAAHAQTTLQTFLAGVSGRRVAVTSRSVSNSVELRIPSRPPLSPQRRSLAWGMGIGGLGLTGGTCAQARLRAIAVARGSARIAGRRPRLLNVAMRCQAVETLTELNAADRIAMMSRTPDALVACNAHRPRWRRVSSDHTASLVPAQALASRFAAPLHGERDAGGEKKVAACDSCRRSEEQARRYNRVVDRPRVVRVERPHPSRLVLLALRILHLPSDLAHSLRHSDLPLGELGAGGDTAGQGDASHGHASRNTPEPFAHPEIGFHAGLVPYRAPSLVVAERARRCRC